MLIHQNFLLFFQLKKNTGQTVNSEKKKKFLQKQKSKYWTNTDNNLLEDNHWYPSVNIKILRLEKKLILQDFTFVV